MKINKKNKKINRKEALRKMGKYAGLTALGTFMLLNPKQAQANSPVAPGQGWE